MKQNAFLLAAILLSLLTSEAFGQTSTELVFKNPVLISGADKRTGAVYRFVNVQSGTDALLTISAASESGQLVNNLDVTDHGWEKAFQPEIGKSGNVNGNQAWWVRFNLKFVYATTNTKRKLDKFYATAIDIDGDGAITREYIQMYNADSVKYRTPTQLASGSPMAAGITTNAKTSYSLGPVKNCGNIDTAATDVMVTYTFMNKDEIDFLYGAKMSAGTSNAALRLNSLWFKSFNLNVNKTLPITTTSFVVTNDKKNVNLQWTLAAADMVDAFAIERSSDGVSFQTLDNAQATGSSKLTYSYTDANVSSETGLLYYRLLFRELSGEWNYSAVKVVRLGKETNLSLAVYPNPVQTAARLSLPNGWQNKPVTLAIFNSAGVLLQNLVMKQASQTETIDFTLLTKGLYVIKADSEGQSLTTRVIKN